MLFNEYDRKKRYYWEQILELRIKNQEEIERLKIKLSISKDIKDRLLLESKINRDQMLRAELITLDSDIMNKYLKHLKNGKNIHNDRR